MTRTWNQDLHVIPTQIDLDYVRSHLILKHFLSTFTGMMGALFQVKHACFICAMRVYQHAEMWIGRIQYRTYDIKVTVGRTCDSWIKRDMMQNQCTPVGEHILYWRVLSSETYYTTGNKYLVLFRVGLEVVRSLGSLETHCLELVEVQVSGTLHCTPAWVAREGQGERDMIGGA